MSESEDPDAAVICAAEWQAAVDCVLGDAGGCGGGACIDTTSFEKRFEPDMANEFRQQIAAGPPMPPDDGFCEAADERMCAYHENVLVSFLPRQGLNLIHFFFFPSNPLIIYVHRF